MHFGSNNRNVSMYYKPDTYFEQAQNYRQPKTFPSPLLILLAATLLAKVSAKAYSSPWIPYKPYIPYYHNQPNNLLAYPLNAYNENTNPENHYQQIRPPPINQQQIINIHERPSGSEEDYDDTRDNNRNIITSIERPNNELGEESAVVNEEAHQVEPNDETQASASNVKYRRQRPDSMFAKNKRTTPRPITKRGSEQSAKIRRYNNKNRVNKRPYTTRNPSYYDYYDYSTSRIISKRSTTRRPQRRTTTDNYDYGEYHYDNSLDSTHQIFTKNGGRRRRRPTRKNNKNRRRPIQETYSDSEYYQTNEDSYEDSREYSNYENIQEILPRQEVTSSTTEGSSSTEFTSTEMTSTTEPTTTNVSVTNNTGYGYGPNYNGSLIYGPPNHDYSGPSGYGPSNGNENISITYGPPIGHRLEQVAPLFDAWYNHYARNSVVRRIQDLLHNNQFYNNQDVNYDNAF